MSTTDDAPVISRTQVLLYGFLALFVGTALTGRLRGEFSGLVGEQPYLMYGAYGAVVGVVFATVVAALVAVRVATLPDERRTRVQRLHTIGLAAAVVGYLVLAAVVPSLVGLSPGGVGTTDALVPLPVGGPETVVAPLTAAVATLLVLGGAYVRLNRRG